MRLIQPVCALLVLLMCSFDGTASARVLEPQDTVQAARPNKPNRHDRHQHDEDADVPTPAPEPKPEPIPPRPNVKPEPDNAFHVQPLPQPDPHIKPHKPSGPDHEVPSRFPWINSLRGWLSVWQYLPSIYDVLLLTGLIVVGAKLCRRK